MISRYYHDRNKKNVNIDVNINKFKELQVFTPDGIISFDTRGLAKAEGFGMFEKNRLEKVIKRFFSKEGVLKFADGEKIDLTMQTKLPKIIYKE